MITTVDARIDHLATAARYAAESDRWPVTPVFDPANRWYHRLAQETDHEVWLLTWLPGQGTDLHDHGGASGAIHIVSGSLVEDTVTGSAAAPRITAREFGEGAGRRFGPRHIHRLTNSSTRPAVSVHVYSPILSTMTQYRLDDSGLQIVTVDRAGQQW